MGEIIRFPRLGVRFVAGVGEEVDEAELGAFGCEGEGDGAAEAGGGAGYYGGAVLEAAGHGFYFSLSVLGKRDAVDR